MAILEPPIPGRVERATSRGIRTIPRRRLLLDRWNRGLIAAGGQGVIALILAMFVFLVIEAWPLAGSPEIGDIQRFSAAGTSRAVWVDPHRSHVASLAESGALSVIRLADGEAVLESTLVPEDAGSVHRIFPGEQGAPVLFSTADGRLVAVELVFDVHFEDNRRVVAPRLVERGSVQLDPDGAPIEAAAVHIGDGATIFVGQLAGGALALHRVTAEENLFTGARSETTERRELGGVPS